MYVARVVVRYPRAVTPCKVRCDNALDALVLVSKELLAVIMISCQMLANVVFELVVVPCDGCGQGWIRYWIRNGGWILGRWFPNAFCLRGNKKQGFRLAPGVIKVKGMKVPVTFV